MEYLFIIIPIITCSIVFFLNKKEKHFELFIPVPICLLIITILSLILRGNNFQDIEYRSYYYTKIRHEDRWNEEVRKTREVRIGTDKDGRPIYEEEVYYEVEYHPDKYYIYSNKNNFSYGISKDEYEKYKSLWNTEMRFIDLHRNYYTIDGDAQEYDYCGHPEHLRGFTEEAIYENRVAGSSSVLKFRDISKEEARELGLYDYSKASVMGWNDSKKIDYLNMYYGKSKQIHIKVLIFPSSKGIQIVEDQKAYWQGGNKNEFVVCVGLENKIIKWAECFSWQENTELDIKCRNYLLQSGTFNIDNLGNWLENNLNLWKRREFREFSYISSYLTGDQLRIILIVTIVLSLILPICLLYYIKKNEKSYFKFY